MLPFCPLLVTSTAAVYPFSESPVQFLSLSLIQFPHWKYPHNITHPGPSGYLWRHRPTSASRSIWVAPISYPPPVHIFLFGIIYYKKPLSDFHRTTKWWVVVLTQQISKKFLCASFQSPRKWVHFSFLIGRLLQQSNRTHSKGSFPLNLFLLTYTAKALVNTK